MSKANNEVSNFTKNLIMENNKLIKEFIRDFKGGEGDEDDFTKLTRALDLNKLGIPTELQNKIDSFVDTELSPMVYESDIVFEKSNSIGTTINGIQHLSNDDEVFKMIGAFFEVLIAIEDKWDKFAEKELKPYLV